MDSTNPRASMQATGGAPFPAFVQFASDVIVRCATDGRFLAFNRAALGLLGIAEADAIDRTPAMLGLPAHTVQTLAGSIAEVVETRAARPASFRPAADGRSFRFAGHAIPEIDEAGHIVSVCFVLQDMTAPDKLDAERAARREAEDFVRVRDRFVAVVSHELRTPLNSVQGWAHVLENQLAIRSVDDPLALRALQGIRTGIAQQVQLVDDLLDTTMAMAGRLDLVELPIVVGDVLGASIERLAPLARERDVQIVFRHQDARRLVLGDDHKLRRVFEHVLSNAIKFSTPDCRVTITLDDEDGYVVIRWRDEGEGIPANAVDALFAPFEQRDNTDTRRAGGLGIGLTLARLIVELHGGRIAIESNGDGPGSTLSIALAELPASTGLALPVVDVELGEVTSGAVLERLDILVVDDQEEAREALRALLVQMGANVEVRDSCASALEAVASAPRRPDAVVCDIAMPDEDGYVFVKRLREQENAAGRAGHPLRRVPVVALSAYAHGPSGAESIDFDAYVDKPVSVKALVRGITRATSAPPSSP